MEKKKHSHFRKEESLFKVLRAITARIDHDYGSLVAKLCQEIRGYYEKIPQQANESGQRVNPKLLVGLSGGVDSSVVVYLAWPQRLSALKTSLPLPCRQGKRTKAAVSRTLLDKGWA